MNDITALLPDLRLRLNIEHPSLEDCYSYGYECAAAEINEEENPYQIGSRESNQWLEGWWAGFYGEKPLYDLDPEANIEENLSPIKASNDSLYHENLGSFLTKFLEITSMLAVSAAVGYQLVDLVA